MFKKRVWWERKWQFFRVGVVLLVAIMLAMGVGFATRKNTSAANGTYKILAWNDLGMHCYNLDFADLAVLPPYNNLWVQVVQAGDPPTLVTSGITVSYSYADNTYSVGKTNFWTYSKALFGVDLPPNIGLTGKGLSGAMDLSGDHFIAEGIPITEFSDSAPTVRQPYQLATVVVKDAATGTVLATQSVVTPTSSEMRCDKCHGDNGSARPGRPTGKVETNILQLHDEENGTSLMTSRPVLCAGCHASNALGAAGKPGIPNLSKAMHSKHSGKVPNTLDGCYNCHPGPQTQCLRDVMATESGMDCVSCHGNMSKVASNPNPWLNEPRCDTCHNSGQYNQDHALFRLSKEHGGLYCEACHDSTHAVAPSREARDAIKFIALQGTNGPLGAKCSVCHTTTPAGNMGPHGISAQVTTYSISGSVGLAGVTMSYTDGSPQTVTSDAGGNFTISLPAGWSGTVTPSKSGYSFAPPNRTYSNLAADQPAQNFTASPVASGDTVGVFRPGNGALYLKNQNTTGFADYTLTFGLPGDYPVSGDWNGDGIDTIGVYRNGTFYLRNANSNGFADLSFAFGAAGDQPVVGDWNGDGTDTIGVYRNGAFLLRNSNNAGPADLTFSLGMAGDVGISGDWDGNGTVTTGVFRPSNGALYLKNANTSGFANIVLTYGLPGDKPVTGDWDGNGTDTIGVYRGNTFFLRNSNTNGFANISIALGTSGDMPIAGDWNGIP